jgi:hypothetical protein
VRGRHGLVAAAITVAISLPIPAGSGIASSGVCKPTPRASGPPLPYYANLSGSWWVKNYVWVGVAGAFHGEGFEALPTGQKIGWYRSRPGLIRLYAKRLDGPPADFTSSVPRGYGRVGFQVSDLKFGAPGCWALTAVVGKQRSRFVVEVAPAPSV